MSYAYLCTCRDRRCPFKIEFSRHEDYLAAAARGNVAHPHCGSHSPHARVIYEHGHKIIVRQPTPQLSYSASDEPPASALN